MLLFNELDKVCAYAMRLMALIDEQPRYVVLLKSDKA